MFLKRSNLHPVFGAVFLTVCGPGMAGAPETSPLLEPAPLPAAVEAEAAIEPVSPEVEATQPQAASSIQPAPDMASLAQSLAMANDVVAKLREENAQLKLQSEALGLLGLKTELRPLQERLIAAVRDFRLSEKKVHDLTERLVTLSEASMTFLGNAGDPGAKDRLQKELSAANKSILPVGSGAESAPVPLQSGKIISLKDDLGLAVINTGSESGLRLGTPMRIVRSDKTVARGLVVDVRGSIAGLLLTSDHATGSLRVGDSAKPETISTPK